MSSASVLAMYLKKVGFNKKVYLLGSPGLAKELDGVGIRHIGVGVSIHLMTSTDFNFL